MFFFFFLVLTVVFNNDKLFKQLLILLGGKTVALESKYGFLIVLRIQAVRVQYICSGNLVI